MEQQQVQNESISEQQQVQVEPIGEQVEQQQVQVEPIGEVAGPSSQGILGSDGASIYNSNFISDFKTRFADAFDKVFQVDRSKVVLWEDVVELGRQVMLEKRQSANVPMIETVAKKTAQARANLTESYTFLNSNRHGWKTPSRKNYKCLRGFTYKPDSQQYSARFKAPAKRGAETGASGSQKKSKQ